MKLFLMKLTPFLVAVSLTACGGGGGDNASSSPSPVVINDTTGNPYVDKVGTYASGCTQIFSFGPNSGSTNVTLTISTPTGSDKASVIYRSQEYKDTVSCAVANLDSDVTVSGTLAVLAGTKIIDINKAKSGSGNSTTGTASTATFSLDKFTLTKGGISAPGLGATTTVGYMFKDSKFFALENPRGEADKLGAYFSSVMLTKQ